MRSLWLIVCGICRVWVSQRICIIKQFAERCEFVSARNVCLSLSSLLLPPPSPQQLKCNRELRTSGVGSDNSTAIPAPSTPSTSYVSSTSAATAPTFNMAPNTTGTPTSSSHRNPINITIGANPLFRGGTNIPFNIFSVGPVAQERRNSPMETDEVEDPGDEVINVWYCLSLVVLILTLILYTI